MKILLKVIFLTTVLFSIYGAEASSPHVTVNINASGLYQVQFTNTHSNTFYYGSLPSSVEYPNGEWLTPTTPFGFFVGKYAKFNVPHHVFICLTQQGKTCNVAASQGKFCNFYLDPTGPGKPNVSWYGNLHTVCNYQFKGFSETFSIS